MYRGVYVFSELSANRAGAAHDEIVHPLKAESNLVPRAFVTLDQRNGRWSRERVCGNEIVWLERASSSAALMH